MKAFFDQIEHLLGIRLDAVFPYIAGIVALLFFFSLKHDISVLQTQVNQVQASLSMTGGVSKSDIAPLVQGVNFSNESVRKISSQTAYIIDRLPELENSVSLANQKLTFIENARNGTAAAIDPATAASKPAPLH